MNKVAPRCVDGTYALRRSVSSAMRSIFASVVLVATCAEATCSLVPGEFHLIRGVSSEPLGLRWSLGGTCCAAGGPPVSCSDTEPAVGCHRLRRMDADGTTHDEPCLELRSLGPHHFVSKRALTAGAYFIDDVGFTVEDPEPAGASQTLAQQDAPPQALAIASRAGNVAVAWSSTVPATQIEVAITADGSTPKRITLGQSVAAPTGVVADWPVEVPWEHQQRTASGVMSCPLASGWLVGGGQVLAAIDSEGRARSIPHAGAALESVASFGAQAWVLTRDAAGSVETFTLAPDASTLRATKARLPPADRWQLIPTGNGLLAMGVSTASTQIVAWEPGERWAPRGTYGLSAPRVGRGEGGVVLFDAERRLALDDSGRPRADFARGGLMGARITGDRGDVALEFDPLVRGYFVRAVQEGATRTLLFRARWGAEPQLAPLPGGKVAVAWFDGARVRVTRVEPPRPPVAAPVVDVPRAPGCIGDSGGCRLWPPRAGCLHLSCAEQISGAQLASGNDALWAAFVTGFPFPRGTPCAVLARVALDGGEPQQFELHPRCLGAPGASAVSLAVAAGPAVAVQTRRGVQVLEPSSDGGVRVMTEVLGASSPQLVAGPTQSLLLVSRHESGEVVGRVLGGAEFTLFPAEAEHVEAQATSQGFVVLGRVGGRTWTRFVAPSGRVSARVELEPGAGEVFFRNAPLRRVFYPGDGGGAVEQLLSETGSPRRGSHAQTIAEPWVVPTRNDAGVYGLTLRSDQPILELRRLLPDGG